MNSTEAKLLATLSLELVNSDGVQEAEDYKPIVFELSKYLLKSVEMIEALQKDIIRMRTPAPAIIFNSIGSSSLS